MAPSAYATKPESQAPNGLHVPGKEAVTLNGDAPNGHGQGHTGADPSQSEYFISETDRLGEPRELRVITVGAGASGLNLIHQINKHMRHVSHVVYEKNPDVGGTWYENRYPGCACDIPSHSYQFTWEPSPEWNHL